jgi:hypothetical protein
VDAGTTFYDAHAHFSAWSAKLPSSWRRSVAPAVGCPSMSAGSIMRCATAIAESADQCVFSFDLSPDSFFGLTARLDQLM